MASFPLVRYQRPVAAGMHRLSFNGYVEKAGPVMGTPDEFTAVNDAQQYIDSQRGSSVKVQAESVILRALVSSIDFNDIESSHEEDLDIIA